jgi:hypothetical protein
MHICVLQKKNGDYVGRAFQRIVDDSITSSDEVHVYINEDGKVEKINVLPEGNEELSDERQTVFGLLCIMEENYKNQNYELTQGLEDFRDGALSVIKKLKEFCCKGVA